MDGSWGYMKQSLRVFSHHPLEGAGTHLLVQVEGSLPLESDFPLKNDVILRTFKNTPG